ncbi:MAG: hypothetical protein R2748_26735 [Bryobacterales bacterium]
MKLSNILMIALLATTPLVAAAVVNNRAPEERITENTWQGELTDWTCKQAHVDQVCPVGPNTKEFALSVDGGILLRFDDNGNTLAVRALAKERVGGNVPAVVVGEREGRMLKVESVELIDGWPQKSDD